MTETARKLRVAEAAALAGIQPSTWRQYVATGRAPQADGHFDRRTPYWHEDTVRTFMAERPGQGARTDLTTQ